MSIATGLQPVSSSAADARANVTVAVMAFLTVVDLFAAQAILPMLADTYHVAPAAIGFAVNASTIGMAAGCLFTALFSAHADYRRTVALCLLLLAIPTTLLAFAPGLAAFALLRVAQGLLMSTAFTLTLAYLGEHYMARAAASVFAAYITGNVASNLFGRLLSAAVADHAGLAANFYVFAALNIGGAILAWFALAPQRSGTTRVLPADSPLAAVRSHIARPELRATFGIGFCILFAFIGTFTYVAFVLARAPFNLSHMQLGATCIVFLPSILTTPAAGRVVVRTGARKALQGAFLISALGLAMLLSHSLGIVLGGLALFAAGTFFAQAVTTGSVGRIATTHRAAASGLYLASYFSGGMMGSMLLGQVFDHIGWPACVAAIGVALSVAGYLARRLGPDDAATP